MTQDELAKVLGKTQSVIANYEAGRINIEPFALNVLQKAASLVDYGIPPEDISKALLENTFDIVLVDIVNDNSIEE